MRENMESQKNNFGESIVYYEESAFVVEIVDPIQYVQQNKIITVKLKI